MDPNKRGKSPIADVSSDTSRTLDVQDSQARLAALEYYHGLLPREDVESLLEDEGDYLIRKTAVKNKVQLVLSLRWEGSCRHIVINQTPTRPQTGTPKSPGVMAPGARYFVTPDRTFADIPELLKFYVSPDAPTLTKNGAQLKRAIHRQKWQLSHDEIRLGNKLGQGAFGDVFEARLCKRGGKRSIKVAVKTLKVQGNDSQQSALLSKKSIVELAREARIMRHYKHANVTRCYGLAAQETPIMVVMEFCGLGALDSYLQKGKVPAVNRRAEFYRFCAEAANGLAYLESCQCIHRDVAARNCLLSRDGTIKISDFGLSAVTGGAFRERGKVKLPVRWLAPETLRTLQYSTKTDVWSYGVLIWEIYSFAQQPYPGQTNGEVKSRLIHEKYRMSAPDGTPTLLRRVMYACWHEDETLRPDFKTIARLIEKPHRYYPNQT